MIPYFNGEQTLSRAIKSIDLQDYPPKELIIVDDGSKTKLEYSKLPKCSFPVEIIRIENSGQSNARNIGVGFSKYEFVAFLDQDDVFKPSHLKCLAENVSEDSSFIFSDFDLIRPSGALLENFRQRIAKLNELGSLQDSLKQDLYVLPSCLMIRTKAFQKVGGFKSELRGYEDDDLILRLIKSRFQGNFIRKSTVRWIQSPGSSSHDSRMAISRKTFTFIWFDELTSAPFQSHLAGRLLLPLTKKIFVSNQRVKALKELKAVFVEIVTRKRQTSALFPWLIGSGLASVLVRNVGIKFRSSIYESKGRNIDE